MSDFDELNARFQTVLAELNELLGQTRDDLAKIAAAHRPKPEQLENLQRAALAGGLGADVEELARIIERGDDSWDAVLTGQSPNAGLFRAYIERRAAETADDSDDSDR